jgi:hypothetical protein
MTCVAGGVNIDNTASPKLVVLDTTYKFNLRWNPTSSRGKLEKHVETLYLELGQHRGNKW